MRIVSRSAIPLDGCRHASSIYHGPPLFSRIDCSLSCAAFASSSRQRNPPLAAFQTKVPFPMLRALLNATSAVERLAGEEVVRRARELKPAFLLDDAFPPFRSRPVRFGKRYSRRILHHRYLLLERLSEKLSFIASVNVFEISLRTATIAPDFHTILETTVSSRRKIIRKHTYFKLIEDKFLSTLS